MRRRIVSKQCGHLTFTIYCAGLQSYLLKHLWVFSGFPADWMWQSWEHSVHLPAYPIVTIVRYFVRIFTIWTDFQIFHATFRYLCSQIWHVLLRISLRFLDDLKQKLRLSVFIVIQSMYDLETMESQALWLTTSFLALFSFWS